MITETVCPTSVHCFHYWSKCDPCLVLQWRLVRGMDLESWLGWTGVWFVVKQPASRPVLLPAHRNTWINAAARQRHWSLNRDSSSNIPPIQPELIKPVPLPPSPSLSHSPSLSCSFTQSLSLPPSHPV